MPSRERRREFDVRSERFESEVRASHLQDPSFRAKRKFMCSKCNRMFEEKSRVCPRCESGLTMGELRQIPERFVEEARRNSIRRAKEGRGLKL